MAVPSSQRGAGSSRVLIGVALLLIAAAAISWHFAAGSDDFAVQSIHHTEEGAPLCPWRDPQGDIARFFPGADRTADETRVLSGQRLEMEKMLGRLPTSEENAIILHRVYQKGALRGTVLVRRVKGEYGAIEVVLAVDPGGRVVGVRLQRLREPPEIESALQSPAWLDAFRGKTPESPFKIGQDLPAVAAAARPSAAAVAGGAQSLLVQYTVAHSTPAVALSHPGAQG